MTVNGQINNPQDNQPIPPPEIGPEMPVDDPFDLSAFDRRSRSFDRKGKGHWAVPWSDLMMTMFVFFAVLYIYLLSNREMTSGRIKTQNSMNDRPSLDLEHEGIYDTVEESFPEIYDLTKKNVSDLAQVELIKDRAVRITLTNDLLFEPGKAELKKGAMKILDKVASVIKQTPYIVNVVGHTDARPIHTPQYPTNWELSAVRACMVVRYMTENLGLPGEQFFISAHSYHAPVKPNTSLKNRSENRRVEIIITRERPR